MFDDRIVEILLHQTKGDRIRYIAKELDRPVSLHIKKFINLLVESNVEIVHYRQFKRVLNSFETIKLNLKTGIWEVVTLDTPVNEDEKPKLNIEKQARLEVQEKNKLDIHQKLEKIFNNLKKVKDSFYKKDDKNERSK